MWHNMECAVRVSLPLLLPCTLCSGAIDAMCAPSLPPRSPVPVGTVPIYEALERANGDVSGITWELFRQVWI